MGFWGGARGPAARLEGIGRGRENIVGKLAAMGVGRRVAVWFRRLVCRVSFPASARQKKQTAVGLTFELDGLWG